MSAVCKKLSKSRAAYYKQNMQQQHKVLEHRMVKDAVVRYRREMPRLGGRKLLYLIRPELEQHGIALGRDRFFDWLRAHDLLVRPKKQFVRTTNSHHRFRVHKNLIRELDVVRPDQVWVSDITYLRLNKGFCYLALITDAFSRKIIGYDVSDSLGLSGCLRALKRACRRRLGTEIIHHSDRGFQYCSNPYIKKLRDHDIKVSMADAGNCYDNALAERVNGILKNEFNLDATFKNLKQANRSALQAIKTYNERRPHLSLNMKTPNELYAA